MRDGIDAAHPAAHELCLAVQQFSAVWRDVPGLNLTAQIFIKHRLEQEMILVIDEGYFLSPGEIQRGEQAAEAAADDYDSGLILWHLSDLLRLKSAHVIRMVLQSWRGIITSLLL